MEKERTELIKLSFIVTVIDRDFEDLLQLIESYKNMNECVETELIIEADSLSGLNAKRLDDIVRKVPQISYYVNDNTSRCTRKDLGMMHAQADNLAYVDADCRISKNYYLVMRKHLREYKVIRGKNIYQHNNS